MSFVKDEKGQGAAEYILLFGGVLAIAIAALWIYNQYIAGSSGLNVTNDINTVRANSGY